MSDTHDRPNSVGGRKHLGYHTLVRSSRELVLVGGVAGIHHAQSNTQTKGRGGGASPFV